MADLATFIAVRQRADRAGRDVLDRALGRDRRRARSRTEDVATILLRFENGARGAVSVSQISAGRKNSLQWEIDGSDAVGRLGLASSPTSSGSATATAPTRSCSEPGADGRRPAGPRRRCPAATSRASPTRSARCSGPSTPTSSPAGRRRGPPTPTFADGHDEMLVGDAIAESARRGALGRRRARRRPRRRRVRAGRSPR